MKNTVIKNLKIYKISDEKKYYLQRLGCAVTAAIIIFVPIGKKIAEDRKFEKNNEYNEIENNEVIDVLENDINKSYVLIRRKNILDN